MEELPKIDVEKRSSKKKFLMFGLPILALAIVSATIVYLAYHHEFTKTINIFSDGGDSQVSITGAGDLVSGVLNCNNFGGTCVLTTGSITLKNDDTTEHTCNVVTTGSDSVEVSYLGDTTTGTIVLAGGETKTFQIQYSSNVVGSYPMKTTIDC